MTNKKKRTGMLVLVFGMMVAGCVSVGPTTTIDYNKNSASGKDGNSTDGKGGTILVKNISSDWYNILNPVSEQVSAYMGGITARFSVKNDGQYTIHYRRASNDAAERVKERPSKNDGYIWNSKSLYVSSGETVTVTIP